MTQGRHRLAADIGGTFTDLVLATASGRLHTLKVPSTSDDYARAITLGLAELLRTAELGPGDLDEMLHGTTIASNTILEGAGARTGLITTKGFRDILEIRTLRMPRLYDLAWEKPPVLVERALRFEVLERLDHRGQVIVPLDEASVETALRALQEAGVTSLAVCLLHSYANEAHERRIAEIAKLLAPEMSVSLSCDVLPEIREYERTSTTVINAYIRPVVEGYVARLQQELEGEGTKARLLLMQSSGGLMPAADAARLPVHIVESGPAAGVIGASILAMRNGSENIISFDMGGTTAKAAVVEGGRITSASEFQVGAGILSGSRLLTGAGYTLRVPAIDLAEVGAGGGSIVWLDRAGAPQVGPRSAGASPGPVCYGAGGTEPTVTDCSLVLGWLNSRGLTGGTVPLDRALAREALQTRIAGPLGVPLELAAFGAVEIATSTMIRAIRAVSSERGRDPREFSLVAFGGNGGIFGPLLARTLGMRTVVIPRAPGLFSAVGLLEGVVEYHVSRTMKTQLATADLDQLSSLVDGLVAEVKVRLEKSGHLMGAAILRRAKLRYHGQSFELTVPLPQGEVNRRLLQELGEAFAKEHEQVYGHRAGADESVELVSLAALGRARPCVSPEPAIDAWMPSVASQRKAFFGRDYGWCRTEVLSSRLGLRANRQGPIIIEEYDATLVIPPEAKASLDGSGNVIVAV